MTDALTLVQATRIVREAVRNKSYRDLPLGAEVWGYLRIKRKRLTGASERDYESSLDKFARHFCDVGAQGEDVLAFFEPPVGTERLEEFLDAQWGSAAPRTYNKNLSYLRDFFKFQALRGRMHGDPTLAIEPAKARAVHRAIFSADDRLAILAAASRRDRICLRLLFDHALRKGELRAVRFSHFDHQRKRLTVYGKGGTVNEVPIPESAFWLDLERHILDVRAEASHFLLCARKRGARHLEGLELPEAPMSAHREHEWWYERQEDAGLVPRGATSGSKMHKARHTSIQRVLDATGNLKVAQKHARHASIQTTGDIYTDWDIDQLTTTLKEVLDAD